MPIMHLAAHIILLKVKVDTNISYTININLDWMRKFNQTKQFYRF